MEMEMEWNGNGNGMELTINDMEFSKWKNSDILLNSIPFHSTQFHSIPWNSTFHLKMETSAPPPVENRHNRTKLTFIDKLGFLMQF